MNPLPGGGSPSPAPPDWRMGTVLIVGTLVLSGLLGLLLKGTW